MKQIVISGNRIRAHGEDCFLAMDGIVICPSTGRVYQNATVATVGELPSDIDEVGYEYHAGEFIPCAPYGKGSGNIAVFCDDDCKSLKDSGFSIDSDFIQCAITQYTGTGNYGKSHPTRITFDFVPIIVFFVPMYAAETSGSETGPWGGYAGHNFADVNINNADGGIYRPTSTVSGNTIEIYGYSEEWQFNTNNRSYAVIAFGKRRV